VRPSAGVHLHRTEENADEIEALSRRFGRRVGLAGVLANLNRRALRMRVPGRLVEWGFRWDDADVASERWWPQGLSTSAEASDTEDVGGRRVLVASWYSKNTQGSRITFVDLDTLEYRHVLLVAPEMHGDEVRMRPLLVHAGGLVWWGPYLHVAGTRRGLFTCRLDDVLEVEPGEHSFGHRYVLPVRFAYAAHAEDGVEQLRYSFLSLDRSAAPPQLLAGEYGRGDMTRRLVRYPLDPETFHLYAEEDGLSRPAWFDERGVGHMQGVAVVHGTYYVTSSRGRWRLGAIHVGQPGAFRTHLRAIPVGPEDISYWPSQDMFWSLTEYPGHRYVFCVPRSRLR
jgi:hypothetical protein